jgi:hypothetical protein
MTSIEAHDCAAKKPMEDLVTDELMHPVGNDPGWSESYYFNFVDPKTSFGMFTRVGFRPGNGWADALHAVFLGGNRVAFTYGRRDIGKDLALYNGDLNVGGLTIRCEDPHKRWKIVYDGPAQDIEDGAILLTRSKARAPGWFKPAHLTMDIEFEMLTQPHFAARGAQGHFEQSGRVSGWLTLGDEKHTFEGFGVRDKSWGPQLERPRPKQGVAPFNTSGAEPFRCMVFDEFRAGDVDGRLVRTRGGRRRAWCWLDARRR